jgi:hypothetical protein
VPSAVWSFLPVFFDGGDAFKRDVLTICSVTEQMSLFSANFYLHGDSPLYLTLTLLIHFLLEIISGIVKAKSGPFLFYIINILFDLVDAARATLTP